MREIGGYIELDTYNLPMLHEDAIALNCGRNALAYLLKARDIKRLWIPKLICDSVTHICDVVGVPYSFYNIGMDLLPEQKIELKKDEWLYFVNFYSQFDNNMIQQYVYHYERVIIDQAHSYYQLPIPEVDTIYTCRKYFGVADGAFLYTNAEAKEEYLKDESYERMRFLLGRFERNASEFYREYVANNLAFSSEPIKRMSKLTLNLLHGIDYNTTRKIREENYSILHSTLGKINQLKLNKQGTFMYPLFIDYGVEVRKKLLKRNIFIPILWPSVFTWCGRCEKEYRIAQNTLPLPIDQRYTHIDMEYIIRCIKEILHK